MELCQRDSKLGDLLGLQDRETVRISLQEMNKIMDIFPEAILLRDWGSNEDQYTSLVR
jgi:hypothetical protein